MAQTLEVTNDNSKKLENIENEISKAKINLEKLKTENNPEFQSQIDELEKKLQELESQKQKIISETQGKLWTEKLDSQDKKMIWANLAQTDLSSSEKKEVQKALDNSWDTGFDFSKIQEWIIWIILAIFQSFFWGFKNYAEVDDATGKEIESSRINYAKITSKEKQEFVKEASKIAKNIQVKYWIPYEVTVAQAILESGWGQSSLAKKHGNYFGIKAFWKWEFVTMATKEEVNGKTVTIKDGFKKFKNMEESFYWYAEFLTKNERYRPAFAYGENINPKPAHYPEKYIWLDREKFAREIAKAWYATDSKYASKVIWLWDKITEIT